MAADLDRLKRAWKSLVKSADPLLPFGFIYRAKVVHQSPDLMRVDVVPEFTDDLLPPMSGIHLKTGVPGVTVQIKPGAYVMVGWENRDPERPYAALWAHPSTSGAADATGGAGGGGEVLNLTLAAVTEIVHKAATVRLGSNPSTLLPAVNGVLTGLDVDPVMELPYWMLGAGSAKVLAEK